MAHDHLLADHRAPVPAPATALVPPTCLRLDPEPLLRLHATLGTREAGQRIARASDDLRHRLDRAAAHLAQGRLDGLERDGRQAAGLAKALGLPDLARAADAMADCAARCAGAPEGPGAALAATADRVRRLGELAVAHFATTRTPPA